MGLLVDNLDGANWNATSLSLVQTSGAGVTNGPVATTSAAFNDQIPDWLFFDITGASAGDTFVIRDIAGINGAAITLSSGAIVLTNNVTIDASALPSGVKIKGHESGNKTARAPGRR